MNQQRLLMLKIGLFEFRTSINVEIGKIKRLAPILMIKIRTKIDSLPVFSIILLNIKAITNEQKNEITKKKQKTSTVTNP